MRGEHGAIDFRVPERPLDTKTMDRLQRALGDCPDVAFAHLVESRPPDHEPVLTLFVWIVPRAMASLRAALNLVCRTVGGILPDDRFVDVIILNSAPELLGDVEAAGCLLVERDPDERRRALESLDAPVDETRGKSSGGGWWPFGRG